MADRPKRRCQAPRGQAAQPEPTDVLSGLPNELLDIIAKHLITPPPDKLHSVVTCAQDIACLTMTSKGLSKWACNVLWPLLGRQYTSEHWCRPTSGIDWHFPWSQCYEKKFLGRDSRVWPLGKAITLRDVKEAYEDEEVPSCVPPHIFHEVYRLQSVGVVATAAKKEFLLTEKDLRSLDHVDRDRGAMGTSHLYALADLIRAARARHHTATGIEVERVARTQAAAKRRSDAAGLQAQRRQDLTAALEPFSIALDSALRQISIVSKFIDSIPPYISRKKAATLSEVVELARLISFARSHANYDELRGLVRAGRYAEFKANQPAPKPVQEYGYSYWFGSDRNPDAGWKEQLGEDEERDLLRLALREWAQSKGGIKKVLKLPAVPKELRSSLKAALTAEPTTKVPTWAESGKSQPAKYRSPQPRRSHMDLFCYSDGGWIF